QEQRALAGWLAAGRDETMVVPAQGRGRCRDPRRGAGPAGSVRALSAFARRARRLGDGTRSERHSGLARHPSADLPRLSAEKKAVKFPAKQGISGKKSHHDDWLNLQYILISNTYGRF